MEEKLAVTIKTSITPSTIMLKLGVDPVLTQWLKNSVCTLKASPIGLTFYIPGKIEPECVVNIATSEILQLAHDKMSMAQVAMLRAKVNLAIKHLQTKVTTHIPLGEPALDDLFADKTPKQQNVDDLVAQLIADDPFKSLAEIQSKYPKPVADMVAADNAKFLNKPSTLEKLQAGLKAQPIAKPVGPDPASKWPVRSVKEMKTMPTVKLRDAYGLYQPVQGTSAGSRYYVVAGNDELKVAARWVGGSLSIRIEGPKINQHAAKVAAVFGAVHAKQLYASLHLDVGNDPVLANKALGAVLLGLGVPFDTPFPNAAVLQSASH
jgi:hypothetical protein